AIFFFAMPFPVIVLAAAIFGFLRAGSSKPGEGTGARLPRLAGQTVRTIALWLAIWFLPLAGLAAIFGCAHILTQLGWFFSRLAVGTIGGAHAGVAHFT